MANTFVQIPLHIVFAVTKRAGLIGETWREDMYRYITGIVLEKGHKLIAIGGVADHVHILVNLGVHQCVSDLVRDIKANSSRWINEQKLCPCRFEWQRGYAAIAYSWDRMPQVVNYIHNQAQHHRKGGFRDELLSFLDRAGIKYDIKYIPQDPDTSALPPAVAGSPR